MPTRTLRALAFLAALGLAQPAAAIDAVSFELGAGDAADLARVGVQWRAPSGLGYIALTASAWDNDGSLAEVGLTPMLHREGGHGHPYFEVGLGVHLFSRYPERDGRTFSTRVQFALDLGTGVRFGEKERYDLGLRLQHISNAGIDSPNPGANFILLRLRYLLPP